MMPIQARIAVTLVSLVIAFAVGWVVHGWKYDAEQLDAAEKLAQASSENDKLKTQLGVAHENERKIIAGLSGELHDLRVRLPKGCIQPNTATGGTVSTTGVGELSDENQEALDRFKRGVDEVAKQADADIAACRVVMEWAKTSAHTS